MEKRRGIDEVWRDHWSLLLYLETCAVDADGKPVFQRMRACKDTHLQYAHLPWLASHATQMPDRSQPDPRHDDWNCVEDLIALGLIEWKGTGAQPVFVLTGLGWKVAGALRRARAETGSNVAAQHEAALKTFKEG